jgi:predicted O-linked N-acetylglucosamine transferase (SPINDLY family)
VATPLQRRDEVTARPVPLQPPSPLLLAAMDAHGRGQWAEAEARYRNVLAADPRDAVAWHGYAVLEHQRGNLSGGLERIRRAIELQPAVPEFQVALGNLLKADGRLQEAAHAYFLAVSMNPRYVEAYNNLGTTYRAMGTLPEAEAVLQQALRIRPGDADLLCNLGAVCLDLGRHAEAVAHLREATRTAPAVMEGWFNLGNALHAAGSDEQAADAYQRALQLAPDLVPGWYNLGNLLCRLDRLEDAGTCYQRVLALDPGHVRAIFNLGNVLQAGGLHDDAIACYQEVLRHRPDHALAHFWWATALAYSGRSTEASEHYDLALALDPAMARAYHMKGGMLYNQGRIGEAIRVSLKALDVQRELPFTFSNSLFMMNYGDDVSAAELFAKHREFQERFGAAAPRRAAHANVPDPGRRIRIGYLSPDLRRHSVSYFIEPVLAHHDRDRFEVHCYFNSSLPDEVTARFKEYGHVWHDCYWMSDNELAAKIAADGIDILVDLAGHTSGNRMLTLARKPAPLQVSWLGYPTITGLAAIDYRITDALVDPEDDQAHDGAERPLRLPHSYYCYRPIAPAPDVAPPPSARNGHVVFGSFNNLAKVSDRTLTLWAAVLAAVPQSRLLIKARSLDDAAVRRSLQERISPCTPRSISPSIRIPTMAARPHARPCGWAYRWFRYAAKPTRRAWGRVSSKLPHCPNWWLTTPNPSFASRARSRPTMSGWQRCASPCAIVCAPLRCSTKDDSRATWKRPTPIFGISGAMALQLRRRSGHRSRSPPANPICRERGGIRRSMPSMWPSRSTNGPPRLITGAASRCAN